jgi:NAD(P)-dependent dehydrogenase (short-subunit alcohol dehydrogenase family)
MHDQVAIVTGAGQGIGQVIAVRLAHEGAAVVVADIDSKRAASTVCLIEENGGRAALVRTDVAREADVRAMVELAEERFGGLDLLVNNAGVAPAPYFPQANPEHWGRTLDVNLRGVMLGIQYGIGAMRKRGGGVVVNISSMAGIGYRSYFASEYAASKAAVVRLTSALGHLKDEGIRVNCICPGWVLTPAIKEYLAQAPAEELGKLDFPPPAVLIPPEQLAELVIMFARDDTLAGRVLIWPDGEPWRLVAMDA